MFTSQQFWKFIRESQSQGASLSTFRERAEKIGIAPADVPAFKNAINEWWERTNGKGGG